MFVSFTKVFLWTYSVQDLFSSVTQKNLTFGRCPRSKSRLTEKFLFHFEFTKQESRISIKTENCLRLSGKLLNDYRLTRLPNFCVLWIKLQLSKLSELKFLPYVLIQGFQRFIVHRAGITIRTNGFQGITWRNSTEYRY